MTQPLVLSLFPGIGLLDMAFEQEGFCVVRGPDVLWGGDIRRFHPPAGRFDGVIGGPPCQSHSTMAHMVRAQGNEPSFPNMIPEFERVIRQARPNWFVMENTPRAPSPVVAGYEVWTCVLNNRQFGEPQNRERRWWFGSARRTPLHIETVVFEPQEWEPAVLASELSKGMPSGTRQKLGTSGYTSRSFARQCELQGLPPDFDIPPFTMAAKGRAVGNGVPLPMGRAIARAVKEALAREAA